MAKNSGGSGQDVLVVILTFNSAGIIRETLGGALAVSQQVLVVDSGSRDGTQDIARELGCTVVERAFVNYAEQRNWAIREHGDRHAWQLHLDADEVLDAVAVASLRNAVADPGGTQGFVVKRLTYFLDRPLPFAGENAWHLRLFRSGSGGCEDRLYDQHFVCNGPTLRLRGKLHDRNASPLAEWTARHNRWSDLEAAEITSPEPGGRRLAGALGSEPRARRRWLKGAYYRLPRGLRAVAYFLTRYVLMGGFLDGAAGFYYCGLQAFWFRLLVDAKLYESTPRKPA